MVEPISTILASISAAKLFLNITLKIFKYIKKRLSNISARQDHRYFKIVRDYFKHQWRQGDLMPNHIQHAIEFLHSRRVSEYEKLSGSREIGVDAETKPEYHGEDAYITDLDTDTDTDSNKDDDDDDPGEEAEIGDDLDVEEDTDEEKEEEEEEGEENELDTEEDTDEEEQEEEEEEDDEELACYSSEDE